MNYNLLISVFLLCGKIYNSHWCSSFFLSKTKTAVYSKVHDSWGGFSAGAEEDLKLGELASCNDRLLVRKVLTGMLDLGGNFSGELLLLKQVYLS